MRRWVVIMAVVTMLLGFQAPATSATENPCWPSELERAALEAARPRLASANLDPNRFDLAIGLSGHAFLTRAQVTWIVTQMLGWDTEADVLESSSPFIDLPSDHWAAKTVAVAWQEGIVKGEPGGTFAPNRLATMAEAELMLARALRVAPDLTLQSAGEALRKAGIATETSCQYMQGKAVDYWQYLLVIDRAMSAPLYARFTVDAANAP